MKHLFIICILFSYPFFQLDAQWVQVTNGISPNDDIFCFTSKDSLVLLGTTRTIYSSTNEGSSWDWEYNGSGFFSRLFSMELDENNRLYIGTDIRYLTSPYYFGWTQWEQPYSSQFPNDTEFRSLAKCDGIIAGSPYGLYNGWSRVNEIPFGVEVFSVVEECPIVMISTTNGVYYSDNYGYDWDLRNNGLPNPDTIDFTTIAMLGSKIVVGAFSRGLYLSNNFGNTWINITNNLPDEWITALLINSKFILVGTTYGVYISMDEGAHWTSLNTGFTETLTINAFTVSGHYILAGTTDHGLWRHSIDGIATGTSEPLFSEHDISFFPNPVKRELGISMSKLFYYAHSNLSFTITNLLGRNLANTNITAYESTYILPEFNSGLYILSFCNNNEIISSKIMVIAN